MDMEWKHSAVNLCLFVSTTVLLFLTKKIDLEKKDIHSTLAFNNHFEKKEGIDRLL